MRDGGLPFKGRHDAPRSGADIPGPGAYDVLTGGSGPAVSILQA